MLPELDVFQKCKYKILVQSNINLKLKRIKIRLAENGRLKLFNDQSLKNRIKYTEINKETKNFDFILKNNTTKNQLLADTIKIIEKIIEYAFCVFILYVMI